MEYIVKKITPTASAIKTFTGDKYYLKDGREILIDRLKEGGLAMLQDHSGGQMTPLPAGEHELADGTKITVVDGGLIQSIVPGTKVGSGSKMRMQFQTIKNCRIANLARLRGLLIKKNN